MNINSNIGSNISSNIISKLNSSIDLWIWDFDDTLINTEAYDKDMSPKAIRLRSPSELSQEFPNRRFFVDLVINIIKSGKQVAIASFGTRYIIDAYMKRLFGNNQKYFTEYNTLVIRRDPVTNIPIEHPDNKNYMIRELMRRYNIKDSRRVAFFDDQKGNIKAARKMGIISIQIPGKFSRERQEGDRNSLFSEKHLTKVYRHLGVPINKSRIIENFDLNRITKKDSQILKKRTKYLLFGAITILCYFIYRRSKKI